VTVPRLEEAVGPSRTILLGRLVESAMAALVLAAVVLLPLVFVPTLDDGYALPKVSVLRVVGLVGATLFLGYVVGRGSLTRNAVPRIDLPLACFVVLLLAASVASVDPIQSFAGEPYQYQGLVTVLLYIGSFYVARLSLGSPQRFQWILTATICTGAVVSAYGIAQGLGFDPFLSGPPDDGRVISSVGQANNLAAYLDLVVIAALGLWPTAGRRSRLGLGALLVVAVLALGLTLSRGGYLGLAAAIGVLLVPRYHAPPRRWVGAMWLGLAAGTLAITLALPTGRAIAERVADRIVATIDLGEGSTRMHLDMWRVGAQVALDHPLLGTGPETFPLVFRPYLDQVLPPDRAQLLGRFRLESPHNELIGVAAEMGLPALTAYLVFLVACAAACVRRASTANGASRSIALVVLATLAMHVVTNFFMTPEVTTSGLFWMTMGAGLAAMAAGTGEPTAPG
jgi:O-antigen ligase